MLKSDWKERKVDLFDVVVRCVIRSIDAGPTFSRELPLSKPLSWWEGMGAETVAGLLPYETTVIFPESAILVTAQTITSFLSRVQFEWVANLLLKDCHNRKLKFLINNR